MEDRSLVDYSMTTEVKSISTFQSTHAVDAGRRYN